MQNQRWEEGRVRWRPAGEVIRTSDYEVGEISRAAAEGFVARHHYAKTSPAGRFYLKTEVDQETPDELLFLRRCATCRGC